MEKALGKEDSRSDCYHLVNTLEQENRARQATKEFIHRHAC